uniref:universal stress protein n=1 Tax=Oleiagrimonas sp. TaxID=2010330 RepID=UPI0026371928
WFQSQLRDLAITGDWRVAHGDDASVLCHMASAYELLVMMRDNESRDAPLGYGAVSRCVFGSCTPVLTVPVDTPVTSCGSRICVAWNGSREANLALRGALPLLRSADALSILDGSADPERADPMRPPVPDLRTWLDRHDIEADIHPFHPDGPSGPAIDAAANDFGADLLVMGAWGRSRISELVLGGATRHLFGNARMPMLVAH